MIGRWFDSFFSVLFSHALLLASHLPLITTKTPFDPFALWVRYVTKYVVSGYGQCSQGLLVNRHFGIVRKIVLYDVTEQVDSQTIEHFVWSPAS